MLAAADGVSTVVISSFWPASLTAVHEVRPELATGLLLAPWFDAAEAVPLALENGCTALHPHASLVDEALMDEARGAGLSVATWTVNDRVQLDTVASLGVATVITDDVTMALSALGRD
jgi:glycerophosphoryl diester phosphodiesterase